MTDNVKSIFDLLDNTVDEESTPASAVVSDSATTEPAVESTEAEAGITENAVSNEIKPAEAEEAVESAEKADEKASSDDAQPTEAAPVADPPVKAEEPAANTDDVPELSICEEQIISHEDDEDVKKRLIEAQNLLKGTKYSIIRVPESSELSKIDPENRSRSYSLPETKVINGYYKCIDPSVMSTEELRSQYLQKLGDQIPFDTVNWLLMFISGHESKGDEQRDTFIKFLQNSKSYENVSPYVTSWIKQKAQQRSSIGMSHLDFSEGIVDYLNQDEKAIAAKKAKEEAERKAKTAEKAKAAKEKSKKSKTSDKSKTATPKAADKQEKASVKKAPAAKKAPAPKAATNESIMSLFDMM